MGDLFLEFDKSIIHSYHEVSSLVYGLEVFGSLLPHQLDQLEPVKIMPYLRYDYPYYHIIHEPRFNFEIWAGGYIGIHHYPIHNVEFLRTQSNWHYGAAWFFFEFFVAAFATFHVADCFDTAWATYVGRDTFIAIYPFLYLLLPISLNSLSVKQGWDYPYADFILTIN